MTGTTERDERLVELADTAWVLGHWYMITIPNSRALADFSALAAMGQELLGIVKSLFERLDDKTGIHHEARGASDYRSAPFLDQAPSDWADFVVCSIAAETLLRGDAASLLAEADAEETGLLRMLDHVASFHLGYAHGWLNVLDQTERDALSAAFAKRGPQVADWISARHADLDGDVWADLRTLSSEFLPRAPEPPSRLKQRKSTSVPPGLAEFMRIKPAVIRPS